MPTPIRMVNYQLLIAALLVSQLLAVCPANAQASVSHISNFDQVAPNIYRGGYPKPQDIKALRKIGVRTIVDLRMRHSADEERLAKKEGIEWVHLPMGYFSPSDKQIVDVLKVLTDKNRGKIYIHCHQGADRTGTVVALYRMLVEGWTYDQVYNEMKAHHFKPWLLPLRERVETIAEHKADSNKLAMRIHRRSSTKTNTANAQPAQLASGSASVSNSTSAQPAPDKPEDVAASQLTNADQSD